MGEKHPDRTNEWDKQQEVLKRIYTGTTPPNKTKEDKKATH
jgi:hypothetical protein